MDDKAKTETPAETVTEEATVETVTEVVPNMGGDGIRLTQMHASPSMAKLYGKEGE